MDDSYSLVIDKETILKKNVKLLGIPTDNNSSLEDHISTLCKRASNQLNAISPIKKRTWG